MISLAKIMCFELKLRSLTKIEKNNSSPQKTGNKYTSEAHYRVKHGS